MLKANNRLGLSHLIRVITCQGSIQLVTALAAVRYREQEQSTSGLEYKNYLVIYGLYAPAGQIDAFATFVSKMAHLLDSWQAIVYITPEQLSAIADKLNTAGPSTIFRLVHELVGTEFADEIYLCRNWQFGNQLLINAYQSAHKVCYGDSIGIYFSSTSSAFFPTPAPIKQIKPIRYLKAQARNVVEALRERFNLKTVLQEIAFDIGYFVLPDISGESPPMQTVILDQELLLQELQKLKGLVDTNYVSQLQERISDRPVSILLTSNLSEAERMSLENELTAYQQFLVSEGIELNTVLIIKPHPRDDISKIQHLAKTLTNLFADVIVLSEVNLFFLPFEVFFIAVFWQPDSGSMNHVRVFAVSSACLSLKLLFNTPSFIGFGKQITPKLFYENYVDGRLKHELELKAAIEKI